MMTDKGKEKYLKHKNENLLRIGVTGHNNKGKSFIISFLNLYMIGINKVIINLGDIST